MPISINNEMMRQIIMDHYSNPLHKKTADASYKKFHMHSDNCIDDLDIFLKIENNTIIDACFDGVGCTISTASTDIMCDLLIGKSEERALYLIEQYKHMLHEEEFDEDSLEEAIAFINTSKQAARIRCAVIGWDAADNIIKGK